MTAPAGDLAEQVEVAERGGEREMQAAVNGGHVEAEG